MTNGERLAKIGYEKWRTQTEQIWPTWESLDELRREHYVRVYNEHASRGRDCGGIEVDRHWKA